jgi:vacuolar protein-sorting-associated protein 4
MNQQMKLTIRPKIESYLKRAEEINEILKRDPSKKKGVTDTVDAYGNSKDNKGDDDDSGDSEKKQMMQHFESTFADVVGLDQAKEALKEAVILPVKFPQLFQGIDFLTYLCYCIIFLFLGSRRRSSGILLYGVNLCFFARSYS